MLSRFFKQSSYTLILILVLFGLGNHNVYADIKFYYYYPDSPQNNLSELKRGMDYALEPIIKSLNQSITFQAFSRLNDFEQQLRKKRAAIFYIPYWYYETYAKKMNLKVMLSTIRHKQNYYQKELIINKTKLFKPHALINKTMALTTMGPLTEDILNRILLDKYKIKASELSLVDIPKDSDAIFAVALGHVDSALVASSSLVILKQKKTSLTATVQTVALSKAIRLPVLCYINGTVGEMEIVQLKQKILSINIDDKNSIMKVLQIDAWGTTK